MKITASVTIIDNKSVPTICVDDGVFYFTTSKDLPSHVDFLGAADAINHAMNTLDVLRKIVLHTLQGSGFLVDNPK